MPIVRSFYFIRHGQTDWNKEGRFQGSTDIPLNEIGRGQASKAFELVARLPIDIIVTSNLSRAQETAEIINEKLQLPIIIDPRIKERNFGDWEGKLSSTFTDEQFKIRVETPELIEKDGESYEQLNSRVVKSINEHLTNNPDKNILFASHGNVYRSLYKLIFKDMNSSENGVPYLFEKSNNIWNLKKL